MSDVPLFFTCHLSELRAMVNGSSCEPRLPVVESTTNPWAAKALTALAKRALRADGQAKERFPTRRCGAFGQPSISKTLGWRDSHAHCFMGLVHVLHDSHRLMKSIRQAKGWRAADALRKLVFDSAGSDKINFDTLCDRVLARMPDTWMVSRVVSLIGRQKSACESAFSCDPSKGHAARA